MIKHFSTFVILLFSIFASSDLVGQHGWIYDEHDYEFNGEIHAIVMRGTDKVTTGTVGAFVGSTCRGYKDGVLFPLTGETVFSVMCYSNLISGETLDFKYFDPSDNTIHDIIKKVVFGSEEMDTSNAKYPVLFHIFVCESAAITTQPADAAMCEDGGSASFTVVAKGTAPFYYQWQYYTGSAWENVTDGTPAGSVYSGASTDRLDVSGITAAGNYQYRCYITNCGGTGAATSNAAALTVNSLPEKPVIISSGSTTFCDGGSITLTSSSGNSYNWSTGATTQSIVVTTSGSYTVQVTNLNGCQSLASDPVEVTVNALPPKPVITASGPIAFCVGGSVTLTSSTGTSYLWSTGETTQSINAGSSGSYTVQVTNSGGCQSPLSDPVVVTVNPLPPKPTITTSGPTTFCEGGNVTLTSGTGTSYLWSTGATNQSINVSTSGSYSVRVSNSNGCQSIASDPVVVTVNPLPESPTITASGPTTFCEGGSVTLTSSAGKSYLWSTGASTQSISVNTSGSYTVRITNEQGCQSLPSSPLIITVNELPAKPTITASGSLSICSGSTVTLTSSPGTSYLWSTSATTQSIGVSSAGSYTVRITNSNGCQSEPSAAALVSVIPLPAAPVAGTISPPTCTLSTGSVVLNGLPSSGTWIINGSPGGITKSGEDSSTTISNLISNTYTFTVTNSFGCTSPSSAGIIIPPQPPVPEPPVVGTIVPPTCTLPTGSVILSGLPATGTWTLTRYPGTVSTSGIGTSTTVSDIPPGTYNFTVRNQAGCVSSLSQNVIIPGQPPLPPAPAVGTITHPTCDVATGSVVLSGLPAGNWTLNPGSITGSSSSYTITGLATGTYKYTVTNSAGCTSPASANIVINAQPPTPSAPVAGTITHPTCSVAMGSVVLNGLPSGSWTLIRTPGSVTTAGTGSSTTVTGIPPGTYTFTVTNVSGCISAASNSILINAQPPTPESPAVTVDCSLGSGKAKVTVTSPVGSGFEYSLDTGPFQTGTSFLNVSNGNHTITVKNSYGCTIKGPVFAVTCDCSNPPLLTLSSNSGSTCGTTAITVVNNTFGGSATSVTITRSGGGTVIPNSTSTTPFAFVYTPSSSDIGKTVTITVTTNNPEGTPCIAASATYTLTVSALPAAPVAGTRVHPDCTLQTGSVTLNGLPSTGTWTLTRSPDNIIVNGTGTSTTVSGLAPGTYTFTVTNSYGCTSQPSANVVINPKPPVPEAPVIGQITQPTCGVSTGNVILEGLPSTGTWTVTRMPGGVTKTGNGTSTTITSIPAGATYTFTVTNSYGCISTSSSNVVINPQPSVPAVPSVGTITKPGCTVATGSVVLLGLPSSGSWTITRYPGTIQTTGTGTSTTIDELDPGTYNFTVTNQEGCTSLTSSNVIIPAQPLTPSPPVVGNITHPSYTVPTGSVVLTGLPSSGTWTLTRNPGGVTLTGTGVSRTVSGLEPGTYTFTVTNAVGCVSASSASVLINARPGPPTVVITNPDTICSTSTTDLTLPEITAGSDANLIFTYWMDSGATIPITNPAAVPEGTYYIKGTTTADFYTIKPVVVTADRMPFADAGPDIVLDYLFTVQLDAVPPEIGTGIWSVSSGAGTITDNDDPKTTVQGLSLNDNILLWSVTNGVCPPANDYLLITVKDLIVPTLITPNMDGRNDNFILMGIETLGKTEIVIFDRRGAQVYKNENYDNNWDGIDDNGDQLPDDTYFYVITASNGRALSGYVVIRR